MDIDSLDRDAERVMRRWVLPACFTASSVFCLAIATGAGLDRHWSAAAVLSAVAIGLAWFADQARRSDEDRSRADRRLVSAHLDVVSSRRQRTGFFPRLVYRCWLRVNGRSAPSPTR